MGCAGALGLAAGGGIFGGVGAGARLGGGADCGTCMPQPAQKVPTDWLLAPHNGQAAIRIPLVRSLRSV